MSSARLKRLLNIASDSLPDLAIYTSTAYLIQQYNTERNSQSVILTGVSFYSSMSSLIIFIKYVLARRHFSSLFSNSASTKLGLTLNFFGFLGTLSSYFIQRNDEKAAAYLSLASSFLIKQGANVLHDEYRSWIQSSAIEQRAWQNHSLARAARREASIAKANLERLQAELDQRTVTANASLQAELYHVIQKNRLREQEINNLKAMLYRISQAHKQTQLQYQAFNIELKEQQNALAEELKNECKIDITSTFLQRESATHRFFRLAPIPEEKYDIEADINNQNRIG